MRREEWKIFHRWLETASPSALRAILDKIEGVLTALKDRGVRSNALRMRREIEAEILSQVSGP